MKISIVICLVAILLIPLGLPGQNSDIIITEIGGLFADNHIAYDGGLESLDLNVIRETSSKKTKR